MINKLRTRITILMIVAALISVITIGIISNITLFNKFDRYLEKEKQNRINKVVEFIEGNYSTTDKWTQQEIESILMSPIIEGFDLLIKNNSNETVLVKKMKNSFSNMDKRMMNSMGHGMMGGGRTGEMLALVGSEALEKNLRRAGFDESNIPKIGKIVGQALDDAVPEIGAKVASRLPLVSV